MWIIFGLLVFQILNVDATLDMEIKPSTIFPFPYDTTLILEISPKTKFKTLITSTLDTMVVRITDRSQAIKDCAKFTYGVKESIDNEYKGQLIEILLWKRRGNTIMTHLLFKKHSQGKQLEIFLLGMNSNEDCRKIITNERKINFFISKKIDLSVSFVVNLEMESLNRTTGIIVEGDLVVAKCLVLGRSNENPIFLNYEQFNITTNKLILRKKERKSWFKVSSSDHKKRLKCKVENTITDVEVLVHHGPKSILTEPEILKNLEPESEINCYTADGYPKPDIQWKFLSGPQNFSPFYSIENNGSTLKLKPGYKTEASVIFQCTAENMIQMRKNIIHKIIPITIRKPIPLQCSIPCLDNRITLLEEFLRSQKYILNKNLTDLETYKKRSPELVNIEELKQELEADLERKIKSLKEEYDWQLLGINTTLKTSYTISETKLERNSKDITSLKISFKKFENIRKYNIKDQNVTILANEIRTLRDNIEEIQLKHKREIKDLSIEINNLKEIIKDSATPKRLTTTPSVMETTSSLPNKQYSFKWVVDEIGTRRKNHQNIQSLDYHLEKNQVVAINMEFQDLGTNSPLKNIEINLSFMNEDQLEIPVVLVNAGVEISNTENLKRIKIVKKNFKINLNYGISPVFYFRYNEMFTSGIFENDSITISCFLEFNI